MLGLVHQTTEMDNVRHLPIHNGGPLQVGTHAHQKSPVLFVEYYKYVYIYIYLYCKYMSIFMLCVCVYIYYIYMYVCVCLFPVWCMPSGYLSTIQWLEQPQELGTGALYLSR